MFRLPCALLRRGTVFSTVRRCQSITHTCDGERELRPLSRSDSLFARCLVEDALDEEQKAIQQTATQFAQTEMAPFMYEWDRTVRSTCGCCSS